MRFRGVGSLWTYVLQHQPALTRVERDGSGRQRGAAREQCATLQLRCEQLPQDAPNKGVGWGCWQSDGSAREVRAGGEGLGRVTAGGEHVARAIEL